MQHAKRMRRIILAFVACLSLSYFCRLSHKRHDFQRKVIENEMCFDFLYNFCLRKFLILRRIKRGTVIKGCRSSR
jgi:hypothetical protein